MQEAGFISEPQQWPLAVLFPEQRDAQTCLQGTSGLTHLLKPSMSSAVPVGSSKQKLIQLYLLF